MRKKFTMLLASLFLVMGTAWAQTAATYADGLYKVYWQSDNRGYLTYHEEDYPNEPQLSGVTLAGCQNKHYASDAEGIKVAWYLYTSTFTKKSYLFEATTGKFVAFNPGVAAAAGKACALTTEVTANAQMSLFATEGEKAGSYMLRHKIGNTNYHFCSGCGSEKNQHPVRFSTDGQSDGGTRFVFAEAEGLTISDEIKNAAIAKIKAYEVDRLLTGENEEPKCFAIKNVRCGEYAVYAGDNAQLTLQPYCGEAGKFYFTGSIDAEGKLLTVKIHNAATSKLCNSTSSWNEAGIDWYIQLSENTSKPGFAISSANDLTSNISWNDAGGNNKEISTWNGNDDGSTWEFISVAEADSRTLPEMSTTTTPTFYYLRNARHNGKYANFIGSGKQLTEIGNPAAGSYWYFVADATATAVEGWTACKIYNAATETGISDPSNGSFGNATYYIKKHEKDGLVGFAITKDPTDATNGAWNDAGGNGQAVSNFKFNDIGSIWWIEKANKTAAQLINEAATAKTNALNDIARYEFADYYTYADEAIATAKTTVEAVNTADLVSAVSGHMAINSALSALRSTAKGTEGPQAGDFIRIKNKEGRGYMKNDLDGNYTEKILGTNDAAEIASNVTLWAVEAAGDESTNVKLRNVATGRYLGQLRNGNEAKVTDVNGGTQDNTGHNKFAWTNINDCYAVFKDVSGGDGAYAHMGNNNPKILIGYNTGDQASYWLVSKEYPLTIIYKHKDTELTEHKIVRYFKEGETYTITNPYPNKYVALSCTAEGSQPVNTDGTWSVKVTEATTITVTLVDDLPFKTSTDFATANWQYLQMNSDGWKYMKHADDKVNNSSNANDMGKAGLWAFVGDAINGFKILNQAAGDTKTLGFDNKNDGTAAYMKEGETTWTIEKGNKGFIIRQGETECLNDHGGGGVMKFWVNTNSPTGGGSAYKTIDCSNDLKNLDDLVGNEFIYALQAERSPLMYSATEGKTTKLSSGLVDGVAADVNDINQQFLIYKYGNGGYYLYSIGAQRFVDENLNFTELPNPVLSFEPYTGKNSVIYPWMVKIGNKNVIPGDNGSAGNKIYHTNDGANDEGIRYRIVKVDDADMGLLMNVGMTIQSSANIVRKVDSLYNDRVYTVTTFDRGAWYYNGGDALWSTGKTAKPDDASEDADKFAFLTVNDKIYLYSVGAGKFVVKSETAGSTAHISSHYATYSDTPTQSIDLLPATNGNFFPVVVKLNVDGANQLNISNSFSYPVIMYNNQADAGNQVRIERVYEETPRDFSTVIAKIEAYQMEAEAVGGLQDLIAEATAKNESLVIESLTAAIADAQAVLEKDGVVYDELMTAKETLATALYEAIYVTEADDFSNNYVYTFVTLRGWVGADVNSENLIGTVNPRVTPAPTPSDDNTMFQWAVYKSTREHYYMYNIGKGKFMGIPTGEPIPFADTPQGLDLTFKKHNNGDAKWAEYPIMFSPDNKGAVSQNANAGLFYWADGWNTTNDDGNNHKVTIVGKIDSETLTSIANAVEKYETQGVAIQALDAYLKAFYANYHESAGWKIKPGVNNYSQPEGDDNIVNVYEEVLTFYNAITDESVDVINGQKARLEALEANLTINQPEAGKFYRVRCTGENLYLSSIVSTVGGNNAANKNDSRFEMSSKNSNQADFYQADELLFMYDKNNNDKGILLSYSQGLYIANNHRFNEVGASTVVEFSAAANGKKGQYNVKVSDRYFYGRGNTANNHVDSGTGEPTNQNEKGYNWWLEEVTTLPVTVTSVGYATLYAPVALEIPEGVTAYVGVKEDNYLALTDIKEVTRGNVIPANTGVILESQFEENEEKTAKTFNFNIATENIPNALGASQNLLIGKYPKSAKNADAKVYTLQNGDNGVGFYLFKGYSDENNPENSKTYLNGFRAWVELPTGAQTNALRFRMPGTTAIEGSELEAQDSQLIYDLQGRRVLNPTKGMYIVGGKKVLF